LDEELHLVFFDLLDDRHELFSEFQELRHRVLVGKESLQFAEFEDRRELDEFVLHGLDSRQDLRGDAQQLRLQLQLFGELLRVLRVRQHVQAF
jgi:CHAD domain-containing protein